MLGERAVAATTMRILFLTERYPPDLGGVARSAERLARSLAAGGATVDVLAWSRYLPPGQLQRASDGRASARHDTPLTARGDRADGATEASAGDNLRLYRLGRYRHWDLSFIYALNVLEWLHQQQPYNLVWGHYLFPGGFLAVWFGRLHGVPSLVSARGNDIDRAAFPPGDFARLRWTLERADAVTAVSRDLARKIELVCDRRDAIVLHNAVDADCFSPAAAGDPAIAALKAKLGIAPDEVVLGFSGELREKKGQRFLLDALCTVRRQRPACLLVVGEVRADRDGLLERFGLQHPEDFARAIVTGHQQDPAVVAAHYRAMDLLLLPSVWEGLPNSLLEGMAAGCCILASDAGGIPEVLTAGETGFLLPRARLHHLGEAALEVLALPEADRQAIARKARDRAAREFSLAAERERLAALVAAIARGGPPGDRGLG